MSAPLNDAVAPEEEIVPETSFVVGGKGSKKNGKDPSPPPAPSPPAPLPGGKLASGDFHYKGYNFLVTVPENGDGPFPVTVGLHGAGQAGKHMMEAADNSLPRLEQSHILVAPTFPDSEDAKLGNEYASVTLVDYLASFSNVKPVFEYIGHSKGAQRTNFIVAESTDKRIVAGVSIAVGLDEKIAFPRTPANKDRAWMLIIGSKDKTPDKDGLVKWDESAYKWAKSYGYKGEKADITDNVVDSQKCKVVKYTAQHVEAVVVDGAEHKMKFYDALLKGAVTEFLLDPTGYFNAGKKEAEAKKEDVKEDEEYKAEIKSIAQEDEEKAEAAGDKKEAEAVVPLAWRRR
jgi:hypothetical protein